MFPLIAMILQAAAVQAAEKPDVAQSFVDTAIKYAFAALLSYVGASLQFGRKLSAHDKALQERMNENQRQTNHKLESLDRDMTRLSAEVWGPQGASGLRKDVNELQEDIRQQGETLAEILGHVRVLHEKLNLRPETP